MRNIRMLLAAVLLCVFMPAGAWAECAYDGNGFCSAHSMCYEPVVPNQNGVYEISSAGQLYWFADQINSNRIDASSDAILMNDIQDNQSAFSTDYTPNGSERTWIRIGKHKDTPFTGSLDGNHKTISGLYVNNGGEAGNSWVGLVGKLGSGGSVKNVTISNSYFYGKTYVGGIVGESEGTVSDCGNSSFVKNSNDFVGGVVGRNTGVVQNSWNKGVITGRTYVGGLVGINIGTLERCYNEGTVTSQSDSTGRSYAGGVVGCNGFPEGTENTEACTVKNCYNIGTVTGASHTGGVAGFNRSQLWYCHNYGKILKNKDTKVGGLIGCNDSAAKAAYSYSLKNGSIEGFDNDTIATKYSKDDTATWKSQIHFGNGIVLGLLNAEANPGVWAQKIGTDDYPVFGAESIRLDTASLTMNCGDKKSLEAVVMPFSAKNRKVTWASADNQVAVVDENGKIQAVAPGTTTITASAADGSVTASCSVVVNALKIAPVVELVGWTYGEPANTPSVTGNIGNGAVNYLYKLKGAEDSAYTAAVPTNAGEYTVKAVIEASGVYAGGEAMADFVIAKAVPAGEPVFEPIYRDGKTLAEVQLRAENFSVQGTVVWEAPATTAEKGAAYAWVFTAEEAGNYEQLKGTAIPYPAGEKPTITEPDEEKLVSVQAGSTAALAVAAAGTGELTYQWYESLDGGTTFTLIKGADKAAYTTGVLSEADHGKLYRCEVSNLYGEADSPAFRIEVLVNVLLPQTGDHSLIMLWMLGLAMSTMALKMLRRREN